MTNYDGDPKTSENYSNPWLMDRSDSSKVIEIDGHKLTAAYIWSCGCEERKQLLEKVFMYYRSTGFPYPEMKDSELLAEYNKLIKKNTDEIISNNHIKNSGNIGLNITKHFCGNLFYSATSDGYTKSPISAFENDIILKKVLMNRMGWNTSKEDGTERPYVFPISDGVIIGGLRNSGLAREVSNFRPVIAKYMYEQAGKILGLEKLTIFDYSCGWGARALGAGSIDYTYYGTDPLTSDCILNIMQYYKIDGTVFSYGSQDPALIEEIGERTIDCCGSCPPYFTMERYCEDDTQCYNEFENYQDWLEKYWRITCRNCDKMMKEHAVFELVIKDVYGKFNMMDDMMKIVEEEINSITSITKIPYLTSTNHLSGKHKTGKTTKDNEYLIIVERNII